MASGIREAPSDQADSDRAILPTTVLLVEDDDLCRHALTHALQRHFSDVRSYSNAADLLNALSAETKGCLIVDLDLPDMSGLSLVAELAERRLSLPTLFISGKACASDGAKAIRAGAIDFIEKPFTSRELTAVVRRALEIGEQQEEQRLFHADISERIASLTPREREVMRLVCEGLATKVIAKQLKISPKTVEVHRSRITKAMRTDSVSQLVRIVTEHQLASPPPPPRLRGVDDTGDQG